MAHILVHLERTPHGLHPASAVALCLARDVASDRGATVTGVCVGDAGRADAGVATAAGRFGCDQIMVGGPRTLHDLWEQLRPVHVLTPWTRRGLQATEQIPGGPAVPRWVDKRRPDFGGIDSVTGIIAGGAPCHDYSTALDPEYSGDAKKEDAPGWAGDIGSNPPVFSHLAAGAVRYVSPPDLSAAARAELQALGAEEVSFDEAGAASTGTLLWLDAGPGGLPESLAERQPGSSVILLPGPAGTFQDEWAQADWVLPGEWPEVLAKLREAPWRRPEA